MFFKFALHVVGFKFAIVSLTRRFARRQAMRDSLRLSERERGSQNGALAAQRLLKQRNAVVRQLVAAVAKEALREVMSEETCAGLIRLVSAVVRDLHFCMPLAS